MARVFWPFSSAARAGAYSRGRRPRSTTPYDASRSAFSTASSSPVMCSASSLATSWRLVAAVMQAPSEVSPTGSATTSRRRRRVASSRARARARPMWPWLARAASQASGSATPSARTRNVATSAAVGVVRVTSRQRERMVWQDVLDGRRAEDPDGAVGGLLDGLEQRVAGLVGEPVGVLDDQDLPALADRGERGAADQLPDLVDADRELLGADHATRRRASRRARCGRRGTPRSPGRPAAVLALQGGGEGDRGVGAAGPGRAGEQPGLAHAVPTGGAWPASPRPRAGRRACPRRSLRRAAWASSGSTRSRTRRGDLLDRQPRVEHEVVVGVRGGHLARTPRAPAGGSPRTRPRCGRAPRTGPARAPARGRAPRSGAGAGRRWPSG